MASTTYSHNIFSTIHVILIVTWACSIDTATSFLLQRHPHEYADQTFIPSYNDRQTVKHTTQRRLCRTDSRPTLPPFLLERNIVAVTPIQYKSTLLYSSRNTNDDNSNNFFQDIVQSAFANDREILSQSNKRVGMLDEAIGGDDDDDPFVVLKPTTQQTVPTLTPIQQAWREKMSMSSSSQSTISTLQVQSLDLVDSTITIDLYLSGVPNKDPSNDLYASKTNISLRDRSVGQVLPNVPTISNIQISFLSDYKCSVSTTTTRRITTERPEDDTTENDTEVDNDDSTSFVNTNIIGDWKLSDDGKQIRFRINVYGFQRTIQTRGTIQKIYWSKEQDSVTETSTLYTIPKGWMYLETEVLKRPNGTIQWLNSNANTIVNPTRWAASRQSSSSSSSSSNGIIKIEQTSGFFGIATKMVPCGKFIVTAT